MTVLTYRIRIRSYLDNQWLSWFEGLTVGYPSNGETTLTGVMTDQAALFGTLMKIRDLGLTLIALEPVEEALEG